MKTFARASAPRLGLRAHSPMPQRGQSRAGVYVEFATYAARRLSASHRDGELHLFGSARGSAEPAADGDFFGHVSDRISRRAAAYGHAAAVERPHLEEIAFHDCQSTSLTDQDVFPAENSARLSS